MEKLKLESFDVYSDNIEKIASLFPLCITETVDKNGNPVHAIDFDKLRQELGEAIVEGKKERYQFTWPMKSQASALANTPTTMTLRPDKESSKNFDTTENLYIEGDNLEVLKVLRETYLGKVKMIYIDPPYNTGKDFVYKDKRFLTQKEMDTMEGKYDEYGNIYKTNTESNGRFHTDWLNMMYPRLKVARDLLSEDGVFFISIGEEEVQNLKKICDEIFDEENSLAIFIWEKRTSRENRKVFSVNHDYILAYAKDYFRFKELRGSLPYTEQILSRYSNPDNDPRGDWQSVAITVQGGHGTKSQFYKITTPSGREIDVPSGLCWRFTKDKLEELIQDNRIYFGSNGNNVPRLKVFLSEMEQGITPHTLWKAEEVGTNDSGKREVLQLFKGQSVFDTPKPVSLLRRFIEISCKDNNFLVLDFFSGSSTTAHAVMKLNAEDGGNRKFIMVQLAEETEEGSEARKAGYKNICEIGKERIRRAGEKVKEEAGLQGQDLDIGFRVLKLDSSNMKDVSVTPSQIGTFNFDDVLDNVKEGRTDLDLLFQIMLNNSIPLSANIEEQTINGHKIYNVDDGDLIAVFDRSVDNMTITEIAKMQPLKFVMREPENSPENKYNPDNIIDNFEQIFYLYSPHTIRRVL